MTQWRKLKSNKQMIQIIPFNFKRFASIWIPINIWKAKIPRLVFTKAIPHVILKQQQRKALSFTSNQQMAVDHSNWITTITNGGIYVTNKFSWCLMQWHSLTFLRQLCTQGCLHFFKKIAGREATRQENVCWVLTVQVLIFLWNYVKPHRKRD